MPTGKRLLLREFEPADDEELMRWFPDAAALRRFAGDSLEWPLRRTQLDALRADPRVHAWTGWIPGPAARRVAHAELVRLDGDGALLARVGVAPADRGRGVGAALLHEVLDKARALQIRHVELNVFADNRSALRLYRAAGFEDRTHLTGRDDVVRMAQSLS